MKVKILKEGTAIAEKIRETVLRLKLDRRKVYGLGYMGELATAAHYTEACSGCSCDCGDGYGCSHGNAGCSECGYTGKRVHHFPETVVVDGKIIMIDESKACPYA